jgi:hypothetical protein
MTSGVPPSWSARVWQSAIVLLGVSLASRAIFELLQPVLPALVVLALLAALIGWIVRPGRFHR